MIFLSSFRATWWKPQMDYIGVTKAFKSCTYNIAMCVAKGRDTPLKVCGPKTPREAGFCGTWADRGRHPVRFVSKWPMTKFLVSKSPMTKRATELKEDPFRTYYSFQPGANYHRSKIGRVWSAMGLQVWIGPEIYPLSQNLPFRTYAGPSKFWTGPLNTGGCIFLPSTGI